MRLSSKQNVTKRESPFWSHSAFRGQKGPSLLVTLLLAAACALGVTSAYAVEPPDTMIVQFRQDIVLLASVPDAPGDQMIYEAFAQTGVDLPVSDEEGETLKGWATSSDASVALRNSTTLAEAYAQAGSEGIVRLYPVFGPSAQLHIGFYGQDGETALLETDIDSWQTIADAQIAAGLSLLDDADRQLELRKLEYWFKGWSDKDGILRYNDEPLVDSMSLMPTYAKLSSNVSGLKGAAADLSKAYLLQENLGKAIRAGFTLEKASAADDALVNAAKADGYKPFNTYQIGFGYTDKEETTLIKKGFGQVIATLPTELADKTEVRVYWLREDGTVGKTAAKKVSNGGVSMSFSDYGLSGKGNALIAYKASSGSSSTKTSSGSSSGTSSDGWTDVSKSKKTSKSKKSSKSNKSGKSSSSSSSDSTTRSGTSTGTTSTGQRSTYPSYTYTNPQSTSPSTSVMGRINSSTPSTSTNTPNTTTTTPTTSTTTPTATMGAGQGSPSASSAAMAKDEVAEAGAPGAEDENVGSEAGDDGLKTDSDDDELDLGAKTTGASGDEPSAAENPAAQIGSKDGGVVYGASMLVIGALAVLAWQFVARQERREKDPPDEPPLFD